MVIDCSINCLQCCTTCLDGLICVCLFLDKNDCRFIQKQWIPSFVSAHPAKNGLMFNRMKFWDGCCRFGSQLFFFFFAYISATCQISFPEVPFPTLFIYIDGKVCALLYPFAYCCMISCNLNIASYSDSVYCWMKLPVFFWYKIDPIGV